MMFITGMSLAPGSVVMRGLGAGLGEQPVTLLGEVPRHLLVDLLEHGVERRWSELVGLGEGVGDGLVVALGRLGLRLLDVEALVLEEAAEPVQRILLLPDLGLLRVAV